LTRKIALKRINIVINASEVAAVGKAVFIAGAIGLMIVPVPHRTCIGELSDWYCGIAIAQHEDHVRLEVTSDDNQSDGILSAILSTARAGKIENITQLAPDKELTMLGTSETAPYKKAWCTEDDNQIYSSEVFHKRYFTPNHV
jgi:nitrogen regulatory protein PII